MHNSKLLGDNRSVRAVLQRVTEASVTVDDEVVGRIDEPGLVVLLGVTHDDREQDVEWMVRKIRETRIMREEKSVADLGAPVLLVSQFTLYGDARKGRRPTWQRAAPPETAEPVYDRVGAKLAHLGTRVERGVFGADMKLALVNDGPVTLLLETTA